MTLSFQKERNTLAEILNVSRPRFQRLCILQPQLRLGGPVVQLQRTLEALAILYAFEKPEMPLQEPTQDPRPFTRFD